MEGLKRGMRYLAAAALVAGLCATEPALAARYELVIVCQNVWNPIDKVGGPNETISALRKSLQCTAKYVPGWGTEAESPLEPDRVGPGISPGGGKEVDCSNVKKERERLQDVLDTLREELDELNTLLANAANVHTAAQDETRRAQANLAIETASCNATTDTFDRLVQQAAVGRCGAAREDVRERCIENLVRNSPTLRTAQTEAINACLFADAVEQDLNNARQVERDAESTFRALWNRRDDTYRDMLRAQRQLQLARNWESACRDAGSDKD